MVSYKYMLFEIIDNKSSTIGYAVLDMINYHASNNFNKHDNSINSHNNEYINFINLLLKKKLIISKPIQINIIQQLYGEIESKYHSHFPIIIDQKQNPLLKIESDDYDKYFISGNGDVDGYGDGDGDVDGDGDRNGDVDRDVDGDYDNDEYEYIYDPKILSNCIDESGEFDEYDFEIGLNKYDINKSISELESMLEENDFDSWKNNKNIIMDEFNMSKNEYEIELEKIIKINFFAKKRLGQIDKFKKHFTEEFVKSKITDAENKINFYSNLCSNPHSNNIDITIIKLKIANQICRKFKYKNLEEIKFNFVVSNYYTKEPNDSDTNYYIKISNQNNSIIGIYEKKQFGDSNQGYMTDISYSLTDIDNNDDIIEDNILEKLFDEIANFLY